MKVNMKLYLFMLCALLGASGVFAQANDNFKQVAPPDNAKDLIKKMESTQIETKPVGVAVALPQQEATVLASTQQKSSVPYAEQRVVRKHKDLKTGAESRRVITRQEYDAERFGNTTGISIEKQRAEATKEQSTKE
jgi:hypothetical protein